MSKHVDCRACSATIVRNYFYDGIPVLLQREKVAPFLAWLQIHYIDIRHEAIPVPEGMILKRDLKTMPNPLKSNEKV